MSRPTQRRKCPLCKGAGQVPRHWPESGHRTCTECLGSGEYTEWGVLVTLDRGTDREREAWVRPTGGRPYRWTRDQANGYLRSNWLSGSSMRAAPFSRDVNHEDEELVL